jgi:hypothetical protein
MLVSIKVVFSVIIIRFIGLLTLVLISIVLPILILIIILVVVGVYILLVLTLILKLLNVEGLIFNSDRCLLFLLNILPIIFHLICMKVSPIIACSNFDHRLFRFHFLFLLLFLFNELMENVLFCLLAIDFIENSFLRP